ncbi:DUF805 domain-containing protein [Aureimonas flava]|uniref:DUF805 domain-containing protein n=1 Tax=Aureimonas flava TaxID=2320271 RepID=A0A3A1WNZ3_9HYPH|nr:DUF805 domain-containing protein [Aureimonas flava]RIY02453.1 DUF805 domain-containing protein [Aureimonas flava]
MTLATLFFTFRGTIGRTQWWLGIYGLLVAGVAAFVLLGFLLLYAVPIGAVTVETASTADRVTQTRTSPAFNFAIGLLAVGSVAMFLALSAKRLRDAGAPLGLLALAVVPLVFAGALPFLVDPPGAAALPVLAVSLACFVPLWAILGFRAGRRRAQASRLP